MSSARQTCGLQAHGRQVRRCGPADPERFGPADPRPLPRTAGGPPVVQGRREDEAWPKRAREGPVLLGRGQRPCSISGETACLSRGRA